MPLPHIHVGAFGKTQRTAKNSKMVLQKIFIMDVGEDLKYVSEYKCYFFTFISF